jgi:hypothetical protein
MYPDIGRRTCRYHRSLRISPRRAFAEPAASPSPFAFQVQRRFGRLARVTSPRSASESRSPSSESAVPGCLRAGRSSATTSSRSVTNTVSPLRTSRRYSDNLDFSCLTPTDFIVLNGSYWWLQDQPRSDLTWVTLKSRSFFNGIPRTLRRAQPTVPHLRFAKPLTASHAARGYPYG